MKPGQNPYPVAAEVVDLAEAYYWTPDIGEHTRPLMNLVRQVGDGFGKIFKIPDLSKVKFPVLADPVAAAYKATTEGRVNDAPQHSSWQKQFDGLKQWVDRGVTGIYGIYRLVPENEAWERYLKVWRGDRDRLTLREGSHRCLALWILGEKKVWAVVTKPDAS